MVESNPQVRQELASHLRQQKSKVALVKSNAEAFEMLQDAHFLGFEFDGLIINERLADGPGWLFVETFRNKHPEQPVVLLSSNPDLTLQIWSRAYDVRLVTESETSEALQFVN